MEKESTINFFAKTNFRNQERVFGIKKDDRRRHMYVIGKTGMGKSNLLENMAIQDMRNGEGLCVVDPHGEFAEKMLRAIPSDRINDVVYFNPADSEFPLAFNILESVDEDKKNLVASGMMGVFKKIWPDVWSPRMEYILNNTILALLDYPGSTMLGVNRMMSDATFRKRVYPKIKDPVVKSFWLNEFDKWEDRFRKEAVAAIQNKVGQFLSSYLIRHIVGQPKSTFDMRDIMDNRKILIANLSKGRIGEDAMRLLGGMIVTKIQLAAMGRVEIPESERKDFYLYVDEFQNFATESFANILSEARKYRLSLILAHQYIRQLIFDGNTTVKDAIFGNVGTIVSFRVGAEDAEFLEKEYEPVFTMNDIVNLAKYNIYLKLMIDGIAGDAFSATTLPPLDVSDTFSNQEKVIRVSQERYGRSRKEVEEKIARWSGVLTEEELRRVYGAEKKSSIPEKNNFSKSGEAKVKKNTFSVKGENFPIQGGKVLPKPVSSPASLKKISEGSHSKKEELVKKSSPRSLSEVNATSKILFEASCSTCEEKIAVPFKPDPKRPTFCKECLKDYQRAKALAQKEKDFQKPTPEKNFFQKKIDLKEGRDISQDSKALRPDSYVSQEKPLALSQISHMEPRKFKPLRKKANVNLAELRGLIQKTKKDLKNDKS